MTNIIHMVAILKINMAAVIGSFPSVLQRSWLGDRKGTRL